MARRRVIALSVTVLVSGCGAAGPRSPSITALPLPPGARVVASARICDRGHNAYCALALVVSDPSRRRSLDLLGAEVARLRATGWTGAAADTGDEHADDSPGHRLRVTFATAYGDLKGIVLGWIRRPAPVTDALAHSLLAPTSTLSLLLEAGSG